MNGYILDLVTCFGKQRLYQALQCKDSNYRLISEFHFLDRSGNNAVLERGG